jgi:polysaccharide pyruvyl transferase WcaK-like protein
MSEKFLLLTDNYEDVENSINIGDKARFEGLTNILANIKCDMYCKKTFPYLNFVRFKKDYDNLGSVSAVFDKWYRDALLLSVSPSKIQHFLLSAIDHSKIFNNPVYNLFNVKIKLKKQRGPWEFLKPCLFRRIYSKNFFDKVKDVDIILYDFGGCPTDRHKSYFTMRLFEIYSAVKEGKKVFVINYTYDIKDDFLNKIAAEVLIKANAHIIREPLSKERLLNLGIKENKISICLDTSFCISNYSDKRCASIIQKLGLEKGGVGLIVRGDRKVGLKSVAKLVSSIEKKYNKNIYFIYTCEALDEKIYRGLSKLCNIKALKISEVDEAIVIIKNMDLIISDRYHGAIFSIMASTPVLPIAANTIKMEGLFSLFKYPIKVHDEISDKNVDRLVKDVGYLIRNKRKIKSLGLKAKLSTKAKKDMRKALFKYARKRG